MKKYKSKIIDLLFSNITQIKLCMIITQGLIYIPPTAKHIELN